MPWDCSMTVMDKRSETDNPTTEFGILMPDGRSALQPAENDEGNRTTEPGDALIPVQQAASGANPAIKAATKGRGASVRGPAASVRSKASSARKGSIRSPASSAGLRTPSASSSRRSLVPELTPEERSARRKVILWVVSGVLITAAAVVGVVMLATGVDRTLPGNTALRASEIQFGKANTALSQHHGAEARAAAALALTALTAEPSLGGAVEAPPINDIVIPQLAQRAYALRQDIEALTNRIKALEDENAVNANLDALKNRLSLLGDPSSDIEQLDKDIASFCDNPIDPKAAPAASLAERFPRQIADAKLQVPAIASERQRRKDLRTTVPVRQATVDTEALIRQELYGEALDKLTALAKEHADADFKPVVALVTDAAANGWRSAKSQIETRIADWKSPGSTEDQRKKALVAAKERCDQVIARFGITEYVDQARTMRAALP